MQIDSESKAPAAAEDGQTSTSKVQANERLLFCAEVLIGYKCEVQVSGLRACDRTSHFTVLAAVLVGWHLNSLTCSGSTATGSSLCSCCSSLMAQYMRASFTP